MRLGAAPQRMDDALTQKPTHLLIGRKSWEARIKGVLFKNLPGSANALFLRVAQRVETSPELSVAS
jgi:hypothetical protein